MAGASRRPGSVDDRVAKSGDAFWVSSLDVTDTPAIKEVVGRASAELGHAAREPAPVKHFHKL